MPITKSAEKAHRQNIRRRAMNATKKAALRNAIKEFKKLTLAQKKDEANIALSKLFKTADRVSKSNFIHTNKANRIKSRATKLYNKAFV